MTDNLLFRRGVTGKTGKTGGHARMYEPGDLPFMGAGRDFPDYEALVALIYRIR